MKKPEQFRVRDLGDGKIEMIMECCEIEGIKTIHVDCFSSKFPYGHINVADFKRMSKWVKDAEKWIVSGRRSE